MKRRSGRIRRLLVTALVLAVAFAAAREALRLDPATFERWPVSRELRDARGRLVHESVGVDEQWRRPIPLAEMGPWLPLATIAVEDERFRSHPGVDPIAVARAALSNATSGRVVSGASTLTMQLARMADPRPRGWTAKGLEALRALDLERRTTKDELLEHYLNVAPYGGNLRGVDVAARRWFGVRPADLSLAGAALLAGLPQSPERLRPDRHPDAARDRRDHVLDRMLALGFVDDETWQRARTSAVTLAPAPRASEAPQFAAWALARRPAGGTTTLDLDLQRVVEATLARRAAHWPAGTQAAVVVVENEDAAVRAYVGSLDARDPREGQVDGARARRSPGSTLKPFVYAAAFEAGRLAPDDTVLDAPLELDGWRPRNFDRGTDGEVTVREALRRSLNLPALRVAQRAGLARTTGVLASCGVRLRADDAARAGLALVTGGVEVRLVDLVEAYATLARDGEHRALRLFPDEPASPTRALSPRTARALTDILSSEHGAPAGWDRARGTDDFAWKTGTSAGHRDAWAIGYDARFTVGVWVGRFPGAGDARYVGGEVAEPVLAELFAALADA